MTPTPGSSPMPVALETLVSAMVDRTEATAADAMTRRKLCITCPPSDSGRRTDNLEHSSYLQSGFRNRRATRHSAWLKPPTACLEGPSSPAGPNHGRASSPAPTPIARFAATTFAVSVPRYPRQVLIVSIGDLLLDIAVVPEGPLQPDDDSPATITLGGGGQAANFCAWIAALGDLARLVTRVGDDET